MEQLSGKKKKKKRIRKETFLSPLFKCHALDTMYHLRLVDCGSQHLPFTFLQYLDCSYLAPLRLCPAVPLSAPEWEDILTLQHSFLQEPSSAEEPACMLISPRLGSTHLLSR